MLTVDYSRLGLRPGERLLDLGCGAGRHAFEAMRLGGRVVALDSSADELRWVTAMMTSLADGDERCKGASGLAVRGDALSLPFPDESFDRVIAAEVLEHIPADDRAVKELTRVLRPRGLMAVTVPSFGPEKLNWALSEAYHSKPGGHVRIYRKAELVARLAAAGLRTVGSHHAHALHSPYWWLRCAVGPDRDDHPLVKAYHGFLTWDIVKAPKVTRIADRVLNPVIGKSLVVYAEKPA